MAKTNSFKKRKRTGGPRTPAGKARSSRNAVKHGAFTSQGPDLFGKSVQKRIAAIRALPHIQETDGPLVELLARNLVILDAIDRWLAEQGLFKKNDPQPVFKTRRAIANTIVRTVEALGLSPESRKYLRIPQPLPSFEDLLEDARASTPEDPLFRMRSA